MFHSRKLNNQVNYVYERALGLVYRDYTSPFNELLLEDNFFRIDYKNIQKLAIEIFNVRSQPTQRRRKDAVKTYQFWSQRRLSLV